MISSQYRKIFFSISLLLCFGIITAQETKYNRFSAELTTGIHVPLSPNNEISSSDYIAFKQFQISGRYMISNKYGLKAHYGYNKFDDPNDSENGITFHRIGLEGVANINRLLEVNPAGRRRFNLLAHGGVGLSFAKANLGNGTDHIGNILLGLTGEIKLNNRFSLLGDVTYLANFRQHTYFDGKSLPNNDYKTGSFVNVSLGIMYSFGPNKFHADWY